MCMLARGVKSMLVGQLRVAGTVAFRYPLRLGVVWCTDVSVSQQSFGFVATGSTSSPPRPPPTLRPTPSHLPYATLQVQVPSADGCIVLNFCNQRRRSTT